MLVFPLHTANSTSRQHHTGSRRYWLNRLSIRRSNLAYAPIENLARCYLGRETKELERILDWGVGCGRVARHFLERGQTNIYGTDIDAVNIEWLRKELRWTNAACMSLDPPMPYPDNHFDLVYGHSVFTHLSQFDHFLWIIEIKRILKPGGIALLNRHYRRRFLCGAPS